MSADGKYTAVSSGTWEKLGNENAQVNVPANTRVRYGANGQFVERVMSGAFTANNALFGDPIVGTPKHVYRFQPHRITAALIGKTGIGKSTLGNALLGGDREEFKMSHDAASCTVDVKSSTGQFAGTPIRIIDTPGLADTADRDQEHLEKITKFLIDSKDGVHAFVITLHGTSPRFCKDIQNLFVTFEALLGKDFWPHVVLVFNKCDLPRTKRDCRDTTGPQIRTQIYNKFPASTRGELPIFALSAAEHEEDHKTRQTDPDWQSLVRTMAGNKLYTCEMLEKVAKASKGGATFGQIMTNIVLPVLTHVLARACTIS